MECRQSSFWPDFFTAAFKMLSTSTEVVLTAEEDVGAGVGLADCDAAGADVVADEAGVAGAGDADTEDPGAAEGAEADGADGLEDSDAGAAWASRKIACLIRSKMLNQFFLLNRPWRLIGQESAVRTQLAGWEGFLSCAPTITCP